MCASRAIARNVTVLHDTGHYVLDPPPVASLANEAFGSRVRQIPDVILPT